jgi:cytochrome c nitrite reductase small subunit
MTTRHRLVIIAAILVGLGAGLGMFTFGYARGYSYLTDDPAACANCHVMNEHYAAWLKSSHRAVATCNSCHTPHNPVGKYLSKGKNGFWHSFYFTTGNYPDPLRITEGNRRVTESTCRDCHAGIVDAIDGNAHARASPAAGLSTRRERQDDVSCVRCHLYVGHLVR